MGYLQSLVPLAEVGSSHGGKANGLRSLLERGLRVPEGVAIDARAVSSLLAGDDHAIDELRKWLCTISDFLAIRSSALNEDGHIQSFAGIYDSTLKVNPSIESVLKAIDHVSKSGRSERLRSYSDQATDLIPVVVQQLIQPEAAGVMFTKAVDPYGEDCAYIEWVYGLGDSLVSGRVVPASIMMPWAEGESQLITDRIHSAGAVPSPAYIAPLASLAETVSHESPRLGWDIEWAIDSENQVWALQMRPVTVEVLVAEQRRSVGPLPASPGIGLGEVLIVDDDVSHTQLQVDQVLVAEITEIDFLPAMKRAAAIVTEQGGLLSHAAIVARELGKPCVVGATNARSLLQNHMLAEVNGTAGTVRQGDVTLGENRSTEIDWSALYLYDRGMEIDIGGSSVYVEPSINGLIAYIDADVAPQYKIEVDSAVRRIFHTSPLVIESDKIIWLHEFGRYYQLQLVSCVEALFKSALAAWDAERLQTASHRLKNVALEVKKQAGSTILEQLYAKEMNAALHALVAVQVEGYAVWNSYRDSAKWRARTGISYSELISRKVAINDADPQISDILACLRVLSTFRNESYLFFSENNLFDANYFSGREKLVRMASEQLGQPYDSEGLSLSRIYKSSPFRELDQRVFHILAPILSNPE